MAAYASSSSFSSQASSTSATTIPSSRSSWTDPRDSKPGPGSDRVFPHIKDIIQDATTSFQEDGSLGQWLNDVETCIATAKNSVDFRRPDVAYKHYLRAFEIAVNHIPKHRDYGLWDNNQSWSSKYRAARRRLNEMDDQMTQIKPLIEDNNARHGTQPRTVSRKPVYSTGFGVPPTLTPGASRPLSVGDHGISTGQGIPRPSSDLPNSLRIDRARPISKPKPEGLQGRPLTETPNDLSQRFARLRGFGNAKEDTNVISMPKPSDFQPGAGAAPRPQSYAPHSSSMLNGSPNSRVNGPREMPNSSNGPSLPPKVPLVTTISMPKPPDATYSPITPIPAGFHGNSNRLSAEGGRPPTERKNTYYNQSQNSSTTSLHLQRTRDELSSPYRPTTPNGVNSARIVKSSSSELPHKPSIDAPTLLEYMKNYNVLIIDTRERVLFDDGHILSSSILCIEPISLKEGVSAEELEDRLVLAPDTEQSHFSRRNEFDIVVYYDQSTSDISYLRGPPIMTKAPALRALYDTLYEFNDTKPLKDGRPPALLSGGIDAWVDYMGSQSLARSKTAATLGTTRQRLAVGPGRPVARQRLVSANSRYEVRNRRLRDHKFLDESEQEAWRQQAMEEEVTPTVRNESVSDEEYSAADEEPPPPSPFVPDYETFLRRFPSVKQQESMIMPAARRPLPSHPAAYMPQAAPSVPQVPKRPPPAIPRPSYSGQADINAPQPSLARVTSATRPPLYSSATSVRSRRLPRTGLTNFGVTCYMNSTLQCLSATIPLSAFFNDRVYEGYVQHNWKGSNGIMPKLYANLIQAVWQGDNEVIKPSTFRNFCGRMNREWVIDRQQDAKEFFDFLVDCLHEDLNVNWERTPLRPLTTAEEMQRERMEIARASPIEWQRYEHRDRSFLSSLFAGQHASRLRCLTCKRTSTTYEAFYSISIEIPRSGTGHIYDCLNSYCREEKLSELWRCPYCKCEREATKQIILTRLPQFLVIHFKRFAASKQEKAKKIHTPIEFPLYGLTMDDFVIPRPPNMPDQDGQVDMANTPPYSYDAYGVLRHLGNSGDGGHYITFVKDQGRGCWRKFDDERHYDVDPNKLSPGDRLQNSQAYIVFYQRAQAPQARLS
ncbi:ubiquitin-specific protease doa4 [Elasticomyces elasticus]|uniref:Ubiquitin-specific protease doa4 n=1 Tax=Exophiala sideris TaxID=1016849 RepID=A0ABR0JRU2_9EURO|nr:ubiquitin-specific protease doa4 [Elasticomyces elasticus]KAK5040303.1 ubiquitin-specific protease doa4 [Exophiala sideris]KAK5043271.1 ubiquitin-specific protease doa4 [Exophiala sideris]KAK5068681.1 ubiquitin-specific protease doa4 [Exophiala sideris]KAK5186279.1 ubiquitin-specific protease doa4 [Eurotiomycetes sp. CCFEE 6388]